MFSWDQYLVMAVRGQTVIEVTLKAGQELLLDFRWSVMQTHRW